MVDLNIWMRWSGRLGMLLFCGVVASETALAQDTTEIGGSRLASGVECGSGLPVSYTAWRNYGLIGDIIIGKLDALEAGCISLPVGLSSEVDTVNRQGQGNAKEGFQAGAVKWPGGFVPYVFNNVEAAIQQQVRAAAADISAITPVTIYEIPLSALPTTTHYIEIQRYTDSSLGYVCGASVIGMQGAHQTMLLNSMCLDGGREMQGVATHEFMHALGFVHEQNRTDRDDYIVVHPECIDSSLSDQYKKTLIVPFGLYDFQSIMHYGLGGKGCSAIVIKPPYNAFANDFPLPRCGTAIYHIGHSCALSDGDAKALIHFYGAPFTPPSGLSSRRS